MGVNVSAAFAAANAGKLASAFRSARALSGVTARRLGELGLSQSKGLRDLISAQVVRRAGPERYFLDEAAWARRRRLSGRSLLRIALPAVLALLIAALYGLGR